MHAKSDLIDLAADELRMAEEDEVIAERIGDTNYGKRLREFAERHRFRAKILLGQGLGLAEFNGFE